MDYEKLKISIITSLEHLYDMIKSIIDLERQNTNNKFQEDINNQMTVYNQSLAKCITSFKGIITLIPVNEQKNFQDNVILKITTAQLRRNNMNNLLEKQDIIMSAKRYLTQTEFKKAA